MTCYKEARLFQSFQSHDDVAKENVAFSLFSLSSSSFSFFSSFVCLFELEPQTQEVMTEGGGLAVPLCWLCHCCVPSLWAGSYFYSLCRKGKRNPEVSCYSPRATQAVVFTPHT